MTTTLVNRRNQIVKSLVDKAYRDSAVAAEINTTLPFQIRAMRAARGWSQTELARRTGQAQKTISDFENPSYGRLTLTSLRKLASAFDVALSVQFVPFSRFADDAASLSRERMDVPDFDHDQDLIRQSSTQVLTTSDYVEWGNESLGTTTPGIVVSTGWFSLAPEYEPSQIFNVTSVQSIVVASDSRGEIEQSAA